MFKRKNSGHSTKDSPVYDIFSKSMLTTIIFSGFLFLITVGGMLLIADTPLAEIAIMLFSIPILGVIVFGALITLGRHLGIKGIGENKNSMAFIGATTLLFAYSWFGGAVLHIYEVSLYLPGILIATIITLGISIIAGLYVYSTDKDLSHWAKISQILFTIGFILALIGTFFSEIIWLAFLAMLFGFIADLVYEIWMTSNKNRTPLANGIALYIAFTGTFVHILQLVLRYLERR
ncbi:MAG: hypothetical protein ACOCRK_03815 [bacterium]